MITRAERELSAWFLLLSAFLALMDGVTALTQCQNGGTFDPVNSWCICTPDFYGESCQTAFSSSDPCLNPSIPELNDAAGAHSPGNTQPCSASGGCINFDSITPGWYRLKSPAGGVLTTACPSSTSSCGSANPFILTGVQQEANANINLRTGRLFMVTQAPPVCYDTSSDYYRVRILGCASFTLYYFELTYSSQHHFCIGNKIKCSGGQVSADGSGYEPCHDAASCIPRLKSGALPPAMQQVKIDLNTRSYETYFNCTVHDSYETNMTAGVRYEVTYRQTYHNGTKRLLGGCTVSNLTISPGGSETVACHYENLKVKHSNIYGGTLECVVKAKCNSESASYISQEIVSLPHRFEFEYQLLDPETNASASVITPSEPIKLCIDIFKVPLTGLVALQVTAKRQALIANDKIKLKVSSAIGNDSDSSNKDPCLNEMRGMLNAYTKLCVTLVLMNDEEDGLVIYGLDQTQMTPLVEVNVSYSSTSDYGNVYTNGDLVRLQSRQLTVDLRPLYNLSGRTDYFHGFTDPFAKPANSSVIYWISDALAKYTCRVVSLMKHSVLPYEVQVMECNDIPTVHSAFVKLAIRYESYLIILHSSEGKFKYETRILEKSALPLTADNVPRGVTIERTDAGVRVKFDLYGTIITVWSFHFAMNANIINNDCFHSFILDRKALREYNCPLNTGRWSYGGLDTFDFTIVPGFYDTPNRIDGIMYRPNVASWRPTDVVARGSKEQVTMFWSNFVADPVKETVLKPGEWVNFCSCVDDKSTKFDESRCAIKAYEKDGYDRTKRASDPFVRKRRSIETPVASTGQQTSTITASMAEEFCDRFVQAMAGAGKSVTVSECSNATGILGGADYISQFKTVCALYAMQLNTFNYTEPVFNSIVNRCLRSLSFNVPTVQQRANTLTQMGQELCPNNCSGNGACHSGACRCHTGYAGSACEVSSSSGSTGSVEVVVVNVYNTGPLCSSRNCTTVYLSVSPFLKSANPACVIRSTSSDGFEERTTSESLASNIVGCSMTGALSWIKNRTMLYVAVSVQLTASDWSSSNSASALVYQESCKDGTAVCSTSTMSCYIAAPRPSTDAVLSNVCEPAGAMGAVSGAASLTLLLALGVLLAGGFGCRIDCL